MGRRAANLILAAVVGTCATIGYARSGGVPPDPPMPAGVVELASTAIPPAPKHVVAIVGAIEPVADRETMAGLAGMIVVGPLPTREAVDAALFSVLADPAIDLVYYNGHEYDGQLRSLWLPPASGHRVIVLDTCWSTQRYAHAAGDTADVIGNSHRAVTGSVTSFHELLDGMAAGRAWPELLDAMNARAEHRQRVRAGRSRYPDAERYRLVRM